MTDDLVIGFAANFTWADLEPFAVSLARSGYVGKKVLFAQGLTIEACEHLQELGFELLPIPVLEFSDPKLPLGGYFAYVARFLLIHRHLYDNPGYRFVVCADTRDVIFQHDPTTWLEKFDSTEKGIVAASEFVYHHAQKGNTDWVMKDYKEVDAWMMSQVVYCSGVISGRADYIRDLTLGIYLMGRAVSGNTWGADQPAYNALMHQKAYADRTFVPTIADAYCLNLVVIAFEDYRRTLIDAPPPQADPKGMWDYSLSDVSHFAILHQYDRMPNLAVSLRAKYSLAHTSL